MTTARPEDEQAATEPDYRFTLANERTFLAWIRTALGLLAGGVAVHTLVQPFRLHGVRIAIVVLAIVLSVFVAVGAYWQWCEVDKAIRAHRRLPRNLMVPILAVGVAVVCVLAVVGVLRS